MLLDNWLETISKRRNLENDIETCIEYIIIYYILIKKRELIQKEGINY